MATSEAPSKAFKPTIKQTTLIRAELASILADDSFSSSKRCSDFLKYVVEQALTGDFESLTERFLGVELFGRPVDYETATDSIVRVRANDVRRRLAQYHSAQDTPCLARIDLVAGGYVPEFHWPEAQIEGIISTEVGEPPSSPEMVGESTETAQAPGKPAFGSLDSKLGTYVRNHRWAAGMGSLLFVMAVALTLHGHRTNFDRFWRPVVDAPSSPLISLPTTDTFQQFLGNTRFPGQVQAGDKVPLSSEALMSFHNWHVSLPVVQTTLSVALALEKYGKTPLVRIGTDLRSDELRGHSVIAIGSFSNPWTEQNVSGLRFTFDRGISDQDSPRIRDSFNPQVSWSLSHTYPDAQTKDFAIITRTFDPVTREAFISLAGLHSFGNQIAGEFVSQQSSWDEVASRAPAGWEKMNLQIVLEADVVGTTPNSPKIIGIYFWK